MLEFIKNLFCPSVAGITANLSKTAEKLDALSKRKDEEADELYAKADAAAEESSRADVVARNIRKLLSQEAE